MADRRRCYIHLPDEKKLELSVHLKSFGREIIDRAFDHYKLKEKEYFGICFKSVGGHYAWLQEDKLIKDHDFYKKSSRFEFYFAVRHFVEKIVYLKDCITVELFYLYLKSLVLKNLLPVSGHIAFKLAAYALQIKYGDFTDDTTALKNFRQLPLLPDHILLDQSTNHCENSILKLYKELQSSSKGNAILRYMVYIENLPAYGMHYYKVKDKSGNLFWLGVSFKGIFQFPIDDRQNPIKTFFWQQIENLYFREKKFTIEFTDRLQRRSSAGSKTVFAIQQPSKSNTETKSFSWYGSSTLIKVIWRMSVSQHKFFSSNRKKIHQQDSSSFSSLADDLTNNNNTLISHSTHKSQMTLITDTNQRNKKGNEDSKEMLALKQSMAEALKLRQTELEDKLYDKVQELKKLCLEESEIIGKIPPEYIRYMDLNEKAPKIKKKVGAEYKVKLRKKETPSGDRDLSVVTTSSSGIGSEIMDPAEELTQLEQDFETLNQIANAAKKLANDSKGNLKKKRWRAFQNSFDKLQDVELKINDLRKKVGQKPSVRASMLISPDDGILFEDGKILFPCESDRSSLSEGVLLEDDTSLSSGGDLLSPPRHKHSHSASIDKSSLPSVVPDKKLMRENRSVTPPPSFDHSEHHEGVKMRKKNPHFQFYKPLTPSPQSSSGVSVDSAGHVNPGRFSPRNWTKSQYQRKISNQNRGWNESSLDSIDTVSTASRQSGDSDLSSRNEFPYSVASEHQMTEEETEKFLINQLANLNHNNHVQSKPLTPPVNIPFTNLSSNNEVDGLSSHQKSEEGVKKWKTGSHDTLLHSSARNDDGSPNRCRRRSSSVSDSNKNVTQEPDVNRSKNGTLKSTFQPEYLHSDDTRNVQNSPILSENKPLTSPGLKTKSHSSHNLRPPPTPPKPSKQNLSQSATTSSGGVSLRQSSATGSITSNQSFQTSPVGGVQLPFSSSSSLHQATQSLSPSVPHHHYRHRAPIHPPSYSPTSFNKTHSNTGDQPQRLSHHQPEVFASAEITDEQRDMLNNKVYQDIGMGLLPSVDEYSSRASVCETASVQLRKEELLRLMEDRQASRNSSTSSHANNKDYRRRRKMREQYQTLNKQDPFYPQSISSRDKTWSNYQKQPVYSASMDHQSELANVNHIHKEPVRVKKGPPPPYKPPHLSITTNTPPGHDRKPSANNSQQRESPSNFTNDQGWLGDHTLKQRLLIQHYLHHNHSNPIGQLSDHVNAAQHGSNTSHTVDVPTFENVTHPFSAPPDGQQLYSQHPHWMSQRNGEEANVTTSSEINQQTRSHPDGKYFVHPSLPIDPLSRFPHGVVYNTNGPTQYALVHDDGPNYSTRSLRRVKKHSVSADDLMRPKDGNSQAGTLV